MAEVLKAKGVQLPSPVSMSTNDELIWTADTGRLMDGTMVGEIVAEKLEPATLIKSEIISRQDALIGLLYDAQTASEEMKSLKADIDREKERLESRPLSKIMASRKD